jgi:PilZ domain
MERERRRTPRYVFIASAELLELQSDVRVASRVSELSRYGCYLDMMNPFPKDSLVLVKITEGNVTFQSKARVVYATQNMGAGVTFLDVEPKDQYILDRWLEELAKKPR